MPKFVAVIGGRNSGKSTVIKSLTGCPQSTFRGVVEDRDSGRRIHVVCSSPQEQAFTLADLRKLIKKCLSSPSCNGIVMAIQPTKPRVRLSLEDIFQEVTATGQFQAFAYVLDPGYGGGSPGYQAIANRLSVFPCQCAQLNGKRFSQINAAIINRATQIAS